MFTKALDPALGAYLTACAARDETMARRGYKYFRYFPDCLPGCRRWSDNPAHHVSRIEGEPPSCRILYLKALQFFAAGLKHRERLFLAANRIGKTDAAGYELTAHLTGMYPRWWLGRRFEGPGDWWVAGDTMQTTRDIIQVCLMGPHEAVPLNGPWTGMIPHHLVADYTRRSGGVSNCLDTVYVEHVSRHHGAPTLSRVQFKSYDQGRRVFQGTQLRGIWLDEEPPDGSVKAETEAQGSSDIYTECLLRTMTTDGILMSTFTPLRGMTPFIVQYLETAQMPGTEGDDVRAKTHFYPDILDREPDAPDVAYP